LNKKTFFSKYFTGLLFILFLSLFSVGVFSTWTITQWRNQDTAARQQDYVNVMAQLIPPQGFKNSSEAQRFTDSALVADNIRITVISADGEVLADSHAMAEGLDNHNNRPEVRLARAYGMGAGKRYSNTLSEVYQYTASLHRSSNQVLRISMAVSNIQQQAWNSYIRVTLVTLIVLGITILITYNQAQTISRMLNSLKLTAQDYASGDFSRSLCLTGFREAHALSQAVNSMGGQLKEKIRQITSEKEKSQAMLNHMIEPVLNLSKNLVIQEANQAALDMAGVSLQESRGKNLIQVFRSRELCSIAETALESQNSQSTLIHWKEEGRYLQVHAGLLNKVSDENSSLLLVMNDVTEIKNLELMRKDFVGNVSHELRTPVTSILGFADTLRMRKSLSEEQIDDFIDIIRKQGQRLALIIEDLLTLYSLEEENAIINTEVLSASKIINTSMKICDFKAHQSEITLSIELCKHDLFRGHKSLAEQALVNYIDNAIKYSPRGSHIVIKTELIHKQLVFHVIDNGPGIPLDQQDRIFERFFRVDKARSREVGGTGLGLSIVKHISQKLNGTVKLISQPGRGCDFSISFPRVKSS